MKEYFKWTWAEHSESLRRWQSHRDMIRLSLIIMTSRYIAIKQHLMKNFLMFFLKLEYVYRMKGVYVSVWESFSSIILYNKIHGLRFFQETPGKTWKWKWNGVHLGILCVMVLQQCDSVSLLLLWLLVRFSPLMAARLVFPASEAFVFRVFTMWPAPHLRESVWSRAGLTPGVIGPQRICLSGLTCRGSLEAYGDPLSRTCHQCDGLGL